MTQTPDITTEAERDHWEAVAIARQARGIDMAQKLDAAEAKLAKADRLAEVLNDLLQNRGHCFIPNSIAGREDWDEDATDALKDFKGEKDE